MTKREERLRLWGSSLKPSGKLSFDFQEMLASFDVEIKSIFRLLEPGVDLDAVCSTTAWFRLFTSSICNLADDIFIRMFAAQHGIEYMEYKWQSDWDATKQGMKLRNVPVGVGMFVG